MSKHPVIQSDYVSVGEAAAALGVHIDTIKRWTREGKIEARRTAGGHRRYRRADVEALLTSGASA